MSGGKMMNEHGNIIIYKDKNGNDRKSVSKEPNQLVGFYL